MKSHKIFRSFMLMNERRGTMSLFYPDAIRLLIHIVLHIFGIALNISLNDHQTKCRNIIWVKYQILLRTDSRGWSPLEKFRLVCEWISNSRHRRTKEEIELISRIAGERERETWFFSFPRSLKLSATRVRVGNNERRVPRVLIAWSGLVRMAVKGTARSALGHPQSILKSRRRVGMYARTGYAHACVCIFICMLISPFLSRSLLRDPSLLPSHL